MNIDHWSVLYFFITFVIGIFAFGIAVFTYFKTKETLIRNYLYSFLSFTLLVMVNIVVSYMDANFPEAEGNASLITFLESIELIAIHLLIFSISVVMHDVFSVSRPKLRNSIVGGIAILSYGVSQVLLLADITEKFSEIEMPGILLFRVVL